MGKVTRTGQRKSDHIRINLKQDVESSLTTGLEAFHFEHNALPEISLGQIDTGTTFLGKQLRFPLLISSMTGGTEEALQINTLLAQAAQSAGIAMGVGSQRAAIEDPTSAGSFSVREHAPDILLFANLGAVQLNYGYDASHCKRAVEMIDANGLILHLNPLQEALQLEGDTDFSSLLSKIEMVCRTLDVPVLAKEVGWGISAAVAKDLVNAGVTGIDVAGAGGTSWSQVERFRAADSMRAGAAGAFRSWGIPTSIALQEVRRALPDVPLIASGGLRNGVDLAKCLALGADLCGMAGPFLRAASESLEAVLQMIERTNLELRTAMFATSSMTPSNLRTGKLRTGTK